MVQVTTSKIRLGDLLSETGEFNPEDILFVEEFSFGSEALKPEVSFVIPVYNQEELIATNLQSIFENSITTNEIIVIIDGCTDSTNHRVHNWVESISGDSLNTNRVVVVVSAESHFETISDMVGVGLSSGTYILEVQADMTIEHHGFDQKLIRTLKAFDDVVLVSGRGTHSLYEVNPGRKTSKFKVFFEAQLVIWSYKLHLEELYSRLLWRRAGAAGRLGPAVDFKVRKPNDNRVFLGQTVMRGPIIFEKNKFLELGGFDTSSFFLGNDDHDFSLRAWVRGKYRTAYTAVAFTSPLEAGSTRAEKSELEKNKFKALNNAYVQRQASSALSQHWNSRDDLPQPEIRHLN